MNRRDFFSGVAAVAVGVVLGKILGTLTLNRRRTSRNLSKVVQEVLVKGPGIEQVANLPRIYYTGVNPEGTPDPDYDPKPVNYSADSREYLFYDREPLVVSSLQSNWKKHWKGR